jgi:hypothetical protein
MKILEHGDADEATDRNLALEIGKVLERKYPNHPWLVGFQGRALVIRHLAIASEVARVLGREGFCAMLPPDKMNTPTELSHTVMVFGGQLLEAFGLPRGEWDGRPPVVPVHLLGEVSH